MMKVLIVGGGIGGLGVALALEKIGVSAEIYEAAPAIKAVGAGLLMAPNGIEMLNRISAEIKAEVQAASWEPQAASVEDLHGHQLSGFNAEYVRSRWGAGPLAIRRSRLHEILIAHLRQTPLHTGKKFLHYREENQQITLTFEDGSEAQGDLLIGADGLRSKVRQQLFGDIPLRYSQQSCWRGLAPLRLPEPWYRRSMEIWGDSPGLRAGFSQINTDEVYFFLTRLLPAGGRDQPETIQAELLDAFSTFPEMVLDLIRATPVAHLLHNDLCDFAPLQRYAQGLVVLLGDAAHAMTPNLGQGANQALESAWVFSQAIAENPTDLEAALQKYQALRIPRVRQIIETSWRIGAVSNLKHGLGLRNWLMSHLPASLAHKQLDSVFQVA
jgi:2-polyprenyl-6-methoxyphenol hydroxylase-like FAD-dependent oxidoreductase